VAACVFTDFFFATTGELETGVTDFLVGFNVNTGDDGDIIGLVVDGDFGPRKIEGKYFNEKIVEKF
jgi:hypothetical protein